MTKIKDKVVLITGGANGIGKMLGEKCLRLGAKSLIIWDINQQNMSQTKEEFMQKGFSNVLTFTVDVSDTQDIEQNAHNTLAQVGTVDILFNNAGIVSGKDFKDQTAREIDKTILINVLGVMHTTRVFLPAMLAKGAGHIINIGSAASLTPNPKMAVYASSKWAVMGWSESLRIELESLKQDLHVTTILPAYINTGMFDGVKQAFITPVMTPDYITNKIIRGIERNKLIVMEPFSVRLLPFVRAFLSPRAFDWFGGNFFGIYKTMQDFKGRPEKEAIPEKPVNVEH